MDPREAKTIEESAVRPGLETIRNRVDQFGVAEPVIVPQGDKEILVQLPGSRIPSGPSNSSAGPPPGVQAGG
jgi:preprotein translocase subunit SecD